MLGVGLDHPGRPNLVDPRASARVTGTNRQEIVFIAELMDVDTIRSPLVQVARVCVDPTEVTGRGPDPIRKLVPWEDPLTADRAQGVMDVHRADCTHPDRCGGSIQAGGSLGAVGRATGPSTRRHGR